MKRVLINELVENEESRISGFASKIRDTKYMIFVILLIYLKQMYTIKQVSLNLLFLQYILLLIFLDLFC